MSVVILFGHRQNCGKNLCCDILSDILSKNKIEYYQNSFAKNLKLQASDKYNLDFTKMDDQKYKDWTPPHLNGLSVRDVLIKEGNSARDIWIHTWAWYCYKEIFSFNKPVSFVSDFRFPNEYNSFDNLFDMYNSVNGENCISKPKLIKVQVVRPSQPIKNDGADGELPDDFEFWDYNIINEERDDYIQILESQLIEILGKENVI